jgi:hypothetical protein
VFQPLPPATYTHSLTHSLTPGLRHQQIGLPASLILSPTRSRPPNHSLRQIERQKKSSTAEPLVLSSMAALHSHSHSHGDDADCHAAGALAAALVNFPLWRAGALLLYGAQVEGRSQAARLFHAALRPPYRATFASIFAMTWSRGAVFYGSDRGKCLGDAPAHLLQQFVLVCLCACVSFLSLSHQTNPSAIRWCGVQATISSASRAADMLLLL